MKASLSKTRKQKKPSREKAKDSHSLYESKVLSWENLLEVDESEFDFPGEDFGLDFPVSVLENHKRQTDLDRKQSKGKTGEREK